ncbi:Rv0909 family putative TA system antitoxin [Rathayibacter iranicus]|uniref:Antitoxin protein n=2 Tax=Rathayibacter iranicus TaxID=59737 RepID=A0AAD1AE38_9MICO|nr:Rv0909 family putative TA system antitoxin [Rathayibacter iranicus]AZZ56612.1 antitoxin protein [Rathayibacter iranicus]MWV32416.1 antitoxin [Rathayibacter iranicus NCPPB 2253 = VKM Ac-1602]PPI43377.1 antitoxin protein [Rathayibacter iranicus]PPI58469.1 antitoxin protein [Rathayibacter iranicus]PPI69480.1 antitoxin protein [Rathayibacter iranicus]
MVDLGGLADKAKNAANSDKGEELTDKGLDKAADAADSATGGKFAGQVDKAQEAGDQHVGTD